MMMAMQEWERGLAWETALSMGAEAVVVALAAVVVAGAALPMGEKRRLPTTSDAPLTVPPTTQSPSSAHVPRSTTARSGLLCDRPAPASASCAASARAWWRPCPMQPPATCVAPRTRAPLSWVTFPGTWGCWQRLWTRHTLQPSLRCEWWWWRWWRVGWWLVGGNTGNLWEGALGFSSCPELALDQADRRRVLRRSHTFPRSLLAG
jgi:hypothetical protein